MRHYLVCFALLLMFAGKALGEPVTIRVLHLNDFHGYASPTTTPGSRTSLGGAARLATKIKQLRSQQPSLFLAAGDMLQGHAWARASQGKNVLELLHLLELDAMTLGSHDLDFGQTVLKKRIAEAGFPVLAANLNGLPGVIPRIYFNRSGIRIAVIGLVAEDPPQKKSHATVAGLAFSSSLEAARDQIAEAELTADLVILLTHQGYERDHMLAQALCDQTSPATPVPILIVGGGSHTFLQQPVQIGNCSVVQAGEYGKVLGQVDLTIDNGKLLAVTGRLHSITSALGAGNPTVAALVRRYQRLASSPQAPAQRKPAADRNP